MNDIEKIEFMRKIHCDEISIWDEYGNGPNDEHERFLEIHKEFRESGDCTLIGCLMELFDDKCYELSWMHMLEDTVCIIAERFDESGIYEILRNFKKVKQEGSFHGYFCLMNMMLSSFDTEDIINAAIKLDEKDKKLFISIIEEVKAGNHDDIEEEEKILKELK